MERINMTKTEKKVLKELYAGRTDVPSDISYDAYADAARTLRKLGFVKCTFLTNGKIASIKLSSIGRNYIFNNSSLGNPINWSKWAAIAGIATALIALAAIVIGCVAILK